MLVKLLEHTPDPEMVIAERAAICYDGHVDNDSCQKRIATLVYWKHDSTFRFASATFGVSEISRVCSHQLVRVAHAGILQMSDRYNSAEKRHTVIPPSYRKAPELYSEAVAFLEQAKLLYTKLIANGVHMEDARYVLPQAITTELVITGNLQMWLHFLQLRTSNRAQWEVRSVAKAIGKKLYEIAPTIFAAYA